MHHDHNCMRLLPSGLAGGQSGAVSASVMKQHPLLRWGASALVCGGVRLYPHSFSRQRAIFTLSPPHARMHANIVGPLRSTVNANYQSATSMTHYAFIMSHLRFCSRLAYPLPLLNKSEHIDIHRCCIHCIALLL